MNNVLLNLTHLWWLNAAFLGIAATNQLRDTVVTNDIKWDDQVNGMDSAGNPARNLQGQRALGKISYPLVN